MVAVTFPTNKTIFITGGGSGIGLALARQLSKLGNRIIICGRSEDKLIRACAEIEHCEYLICDVSKIDDVDTVARYFAGNHLELDILINNAGSGDGYFLGEGAQWNQQLSQDIATNLLGPMQLTQSLLKFFPERGRGKIVNINSGFGLWPSAAVPGYSISKCGLHAYSRILRVHLSDRPISILDVFPPLVDTRLVEDIPIRKMSPEAVATKIVQAICKNKSEVYIGQVRWVRVLSKCFPSVRNLILKHYPISFQEMKLRRPPKK